MTFDPETLRRYQAQKNLPAHPAPLETDGGTQYYADSEPPLTQADSEKFVELLALNRTVRSAPRTNVQSRRNDSREMLAWAIIACVFGIGLAVGLMIAGAVLWRH